VHQEIIRNRSIKILKLVLVVLLVTITIKQSSSFNPRIDDWYTIEPWELEICSKWGGTKEAQSGATSSAAIYLSQTTLSLQGKKQSYDIAGVNRSLYTVSWYLEPLDEMSYRVELINDDESISFKVGDGDSSYSEPAVGYHSEYYDKEFTAVKIQYGLNWLKVPLIDLE
jgi:hypothetical protein